MTVAFRYPHYLPSYPHSNKLTLHYYITDYQYNTFILEHKPTILKVSHFKAFISNIPINTSVSICNRDNNHSSLRYY